jgi:hypothetical protein
VYKKSAIIFLVFLLCTILTGCNLFSATVNREYWFTSVDEITDAMEKMGKADTIDTYYYSDIMGLDESITDFNYGIYGVFKLSSSIDYMGTPGKLVYLYETSSVSVNNILIIYDVWNVPSTENNTYYYEEIASLTNLPIIDNLQADNTCTKEFTKSLYQEIEDDLISNYTYSMYYFNEEEKVSLYQIVFIYTMNSDRDLKYEVKILDLILENVLIITI